MSSRPMPPTTKGLFAEGESDFPMLSGFWAVRVAWAVGNMAWLSVIYGAGMSEPIRIKEFLGGPLNGNEAFWFDPHKEVQEVSYPLQTGSVRKARYRLVKGMVQGQPFLAYVDNDLGRAEALTLIAGKLIQIDSIG